MAPIILVCTCDCIRVHGSKINMLLTYVVCLVDSVHS